MSSRQGSIRQQVQCHKVSVPTIGVASKSTDGIVEIQYPDCTKLMVIPPELGGGVTFTNASGTCMQYTTTDDMPRIVRERFDQMPIVLSYLSSQASECTPLTSRPVQPPLLKFLR